MPTVDTASTVAMDRSLKRDKKEMIEMLSSFRYLDRACGESIRTEFLELKKKMQRPNDGASSKKSKTF